MMENNQLFRKKSLDRISSPEELHDYMRVTSPRLWMILTAIVALLAGLIVYASTVTMENTIPIRVKLESYPLDDEHESDGETRYHTFVYFTMPLSQIDSIRMGTEVRLGTERGKVQWMSTEDEGQDTMMIMVDMEHDYIPMRDGEYDAVLVIESTTPISFLWN